MKITTVLIFCQYSMLVLVSPASAVDYTAWQKFLDHYNRGGLVNYAGVQRNPVLLEEAIASVENVSEEQYAGWSADAQKAFWINTYNIATIKLIMEHFPLKRSFSVQALRYPAQSIQQIPNVWDREAITIMGEGISLNKIEHEILRKEFFDPRIHFAVVCASKGCPILQAESFEPERLDNQLSSATVQFVVDSSKVRLDSTGGSAALSPIFRWFAEDFESSGGPVRFINRFLPVESKIPEDARVIWMNYDWSLNTQ